MSKQQIKKQEQKVFDKKKDIKTINFPDLFEKYFKGKGIYLLVGLLAVICIFAYFDYLTFSKFLVFKDIGSDSMNQTYPTALGTAHYYNEVGNLNGWNFSLGMGEPGGGLRLFNLDVFGSLLPYLFGGDVAYGIIFQELYKLILAGLFFGLYLKVAGVKNFSAVIGGLLYGFSSCVVIGTVGWPPHSSEGMNIALLLLATELAYKKNSYILYPIAFGFLGLFNAYLHLFIVFVYPVFRYLDDNGFQWKGLGKLVLKFGCLMLVGLIFFGGFNILTDILFSGFKTAAIAGEGRAAEGAALANELKTFPMFGFGDKILYVSSIMRMYGSDMMGAGSAFRTLDLTQQTNLAFRAWQNYLEAPWFYCGLITLLLYPQLFKYLAKRQKILYGILLGMMFIPFIFPYFRYLYFNFSLDYFRWLSLSVYAILLFSAMRTLNSIDKTFKVNLIYLGGTLALFLILLFIPWYPNNAHVETSLRTFTAIFLVIYAVLIYLMGMPKLKFYAQIAILFFVVVELAYFTNYSANKRDALTIQELNSKVGYNDYTLDGLNMLKTIDKSFFRIEKSYSSGTAIHASLNDSEAQNYFATKKYYTSSAYYTKFLTAIDVINPKQPAANRWMMGLVNKPLLYSFASIKYFFVRPQEVPNFMNFGFDTLASYPNVVVMKNRNPLPMGFCYDKYCLQSDFYKLGIANRDLRFLKSFIINDQDSGKFAQFTKLNPTDTATMLTWDTVSTMINELKKDTLQMVEWNQNYFKGTINLDKPKFLFFTILYHKDWTAYVDGKETPLEVANIGFSGLTLAPGQHTVELKFKTTTFGEAMLDYWTRAGLFLALCGVFYGGKYYLNKRKKDNNSEQEELS